MLQQVIEEPHGCSYLPRDDAQLEMMVLAGVAPEELEALLSRGWRRFGRVYFRPACPACGACVPLRVLASAFEPSKSQRRAVRSAGRFRREVGPATVDSERLALYAKWHANREQVREWSPSEHTKESYARDFASPHPCLREVTFRDDDAGGRLVGVGLWDEMPGSLSAIFFFYDPSIEHGSLGVANVVTGIEAAKNAGKAHVYLGYRVADCASLRYKSAYRPHEVLVGRPGLHETPEWVAAESALQR